MKNKKLLTVGLISVASVLTLAACGDEEKEDKKIEDKKVEDKDVDTKTAPATEVEEITEDVNLSDESETVVKPEGTVVLSKDVVEDDLEEGVLVETTLYKSNDQADGLVSSVDYFEVNSVGFYSMNYLEFLLESLHGEDMTPSNGTMMVNGELSLIFGDELQEVQGSAGGDMFTQSILKTIFENMSEVQSITFEYTDENNEPLILDHVLTNEAFTRDDVKY